MKTKHEIKRVEIKIPKGANEAALDKKVKRWADKKVYGVAWSARAGLVSVDFWMHTGALKEDPKEFSRAVAVLSRIVARSAPKPEPPPVQPKQPRRWTRVTRDNDENIYYLESPTLFAKDCLGKIQIEVHRNYRGSPAGCFGGADDWPFLTLHVPFQVGEEAKRDRLIEKLKACLNDAD